MNDFANPNSFHWTQAYTGLVGQVVGYTASTAYQSATGNNSIASNIIPFLVSAATEVATAPVVYLTEKVHSDSAGYSAVLSSSAIQSVLSRSAVTAPEFTTELIDPRKLTISIAPMTDTISTIANNPRLAGLIGSTVSKVIATTVEGESNTSIAESIWIALTRSIVLGNALSTDTAIPKAIAAAIIGMDLLAIQTEQPLLHTSSSIGSALYIGSIAPTNKTLSTLSLGVTGAALHLISNSK